MSRVLRLLTLVLSFASLQLTLLGGGPGCPTPTARGVAGSQQTGAATGAREPGMDGMAMPAAVGSPAGAHGGAADEAPAPCGESAAPEACRTLAPCLFATVPAPVSTEVVIGTARTRVLTAVAVALPSETPAPDVPPPRA